MPSSKASRTSRRDLLSEEFILEHCGICMGLFDADHQPDEERAPRPAHCPHKVGYRCLPTWMDDFNARRGPHECPICQQLPWLKSDKPEFAEGARPVPLSNFQLAHHFDTWIQAKTFVKLVWKSLHNVYIRQQIIYDSDIEDEIAFCLTSMAESYNPCRIPIIFSEYWPGVREVARHMLKEHHKNGCFVPLTKMEVRSYTYSLWEVFGWTFMYREECEVIPDGDPRMNLYSLPCNQ